MKYLLLVLTIIPCFIFCEDNRYLELKAKIQEEYQLSKKEYDKTRSLMGEDYPLTYYLLGCVHSYEKIIRDMDLSN